MYIFIMNIVIQQHKLWLNKNSTPQPSEPKPAFILASQMVKRLVWLCMWRCAQQNWKRHQKTSRLSATSHMIFWQHGWHEKQKMPECFKDALNKTWKNTACCKKRNMVILSDVIEENNVQQNPEIYKQCLLHMHQLFLTWWKVTIKKCTSTHATRFTQKLFKMSLWQTLIVQFSQKKKHYFFCFSNFGFKNMLFYSYTQNRDIWTHSWFFWWLLPELDSRRNDFFPSPRP